MHGYDVLDSRVLAHESVAFDASVYLMCSSADACWFACRGGGGWGGSLSCRS